MTYEWLIELTNSPEKLYLSTALSETSVGFTNDLSRAWHFPSEQTAEHVRRSFVLAGCKVVRR